MSKKMSKVSLKKAAHRHAIYYLIFSELHSTPTTDDFDVLSIEHQNLIAGLNYSWSNDNHDEFIRYVLVLSNPVSGYLSIRGYWNKVDETLSNAVEVAKKTGRVQDLAIFTGNRATIQTYFGNLTQSQISHRQAKEIFESINDRPNLAIALHELGFIAIELEHFDEAELSLNEGLAIHLENFDNRNASRSLHELGRLSQKRGDYGKANDYYHQSLDLKSEIEDTVGSAQVLHQLGNLALIQGHFSEAEGLYQQSLAQRISVGDKIGTAQTMHQIGILYHQQGKMEEAKEHYLGSL
jgi:tetratricopeptide (TPR) repeat protein